MSQAMSNPPIMTAAYTSLYGGAGLAVIGGLTAHDLAAMTGLLGTLGGLSVQMYYKRKSDQRDQNEERRKEELHALEVKKLLNELNQ